jgi:hypothetical protein
MFECLYNINDLYVKDVIWIVFPKIAFGCVNAWLKLKGGECW